MSIIALAFAEHGVPSLIGTEILPQVHRSAGRVGVFLICGA
ncbi:hypothetical protein P4133_05060 [Pseudomonas aeruginosa]|nr:hypothetical protein [Pseudomonas aeruginosa]